MLKSKNEISRQKISSYLSNILIKAVTELSQVKTVIDVEKKLMETCKSLINADRCSVFLLDKRKVHHSSEPSTSVIKALIGVLI